MIFRNTYLIAAIVLFANMGSAQDTTKQYIQNQHPNGNVVVDSIYKIPILKIEVEDKKAVQSSNYFIDGEWQFSHGFNEKEKILYIKENQTLYHPGVNTNIYVYVTKWYIHPNKNKLFVFENDHGFLFKVDSLPYNLKEAFVQQNNLCNDGTLNIIDVLEVSKCNSDTIFIKYGSANKKEKILLPYESCKIKLERIENGKKIKFAVKLKNYGFIPIRIKK